MVLNAVRGKALPIYGDGKQIRDWLYVEDHCEAIYRVAKDGKLGETYNVGGGNQPYNIDLVTEICSVLDELRPEAAPHAALMTHVTDRLAMLLGTGLVADITKIRRELGWAPRHEIESGLRATVEWYLSHTDWVAAVLAQDGYSDWLTKNYEKRK